jgi:hypothetical protein
MNRARVIEQRHRQLRHLVCVFRPVVAAFGELDDAAAADVRIAIGLGDLLPMLRNVIEDDPFAE